MLNADAQYFLQNLSLFKRGSVGLRSDIQRDFKCLSRTVRLEELQAEAKRLRHRIRVKKVLSRAFR